MTKEEKEKAILEHKAALYMGLLLQENSLLELSSLVHGQELYKVNIDLKYTRNILKRYNRNSRATSTEISDAEDSMMDNTILMKMVAFSLVHIPPSLFDLFDDAYTKFYNKFVTKNSYK